MAGLPAIALMGLEGPGNKLNRPDTPSPSSNFGGKPKDDNC